jgi:tripartite-type tricarboxylate transporter receptor subunit TctC
MIRLITAFIAVLFTINAYAASQVDILTRFNVSSASGQFAHDVAQRLNSMQTKYEFRAAYIPGAGGDAADLKAIAVARAGQDVLVWNSSTAYSFNRFTNGNVYDRDNDIVPVYAFTTVNFSIMVDPESSIKTFDDFLKFRREKDQAFFGTTVNVVANAFLNVVLEKTFNLKPAKHLEYARPFDIAKNVLTKEADYTIFSTNDVIGLRSLVTSNTERVNGMPTGKDVGMEDFRFGSLTGVSVPKERKAFADEILPLLMKICSDSNFVERVEKLGVTSNCRSAKEVREKIQDEINLVQKYEKDIVFKR